MWKKRLIATVTFLAGLYFFLEYVVPPTVSWKTHTGVVQSVEPTHGKPVVTTWTDGKIVEVQEQTVVNQQVQIRQVVQPLTFPKDNKLMVTRNKQDTGEESVAIEKLEPADQVTIPSGPERGKDGVVLVTTRDRVDIGVLGSTRRDKLEYQETSVTITLPITLDREVLRTTPGNTQEHVAARGLRTGDKVIFPWRPQKDKSGEVTSIQNGKVSILIPAKDVNEGNVISPHGNLVAYQIKSTGAVELKAAEEVKTGDLVTIGPSTYLSKWLTDANDVVTVLVNMAWGMGLFSLWLVHTTNIRKRRPEYYLSIIVFIAIAFGLLAGYGLENTRVLWANRINAVVFEHMLIPLGSTVFSLLTFYMASAAYRSFKAKSSEAILMMSSALIVMLGQIPVGLWLTSWLGHYKYLSVLQLPKISQWILYVPSSATVKGLWFGMMLGAIAVGLRFWLSLERGAYFDSEM